MRIAGGGLLAILAQTSQGSAVKSAALDALLARAGAYLEQYSDPGNGLLLEERYNQQVNATPPRMRDLKSELLILPDAIEGWVEFRDVLAVDGKPIVDRTDRLLRLFSAPGGDSRNLARRITDEGARYNISGAVEVKRTLNHPMIPLSHLRSVNQPRSEFRMQGNPGGGGQHVSFAEVRQPPALIGTAARKRQPASSGSIRQPVA
jgi:hypothetical protein